MGIPADGENELAQACHECRQHGWDKAAGILARAWQDEIKAAKHPRRRMVEVKLKNGGKAWIERGRLSEAEEYDG